MIKTVLADWDSLTLACVQTWWLCISSCCFSSSSNWACWVALVGSDWLEHWGKRITRDDFNKWTKIGWTVCKSASLYYCTCCNMRSANSSRLRRSSTSNFNAPFSSLLSFICSDSSEFCCLVSSLTLLWMETFRNYNMWTFNVWQSLKGKSLTLV